MLACVANVDSITRQIGLVSFKGVVIHDDYWLVFDVVDYLRSVTIRFCSTICCGTGLKVGLIVSSVVLEDWIVDRNGSSKQTNVVLKDIFLENHRPFWLPNVDCRVLLHLGMESRILLCKRVQVVTEESLFLIKSVTVSC